MREKKIKIIRRLMMVDCKKGREKKGKLDND